MIQTVARRTDIIVETLHGESVLYDPKLKKAHNLNSVLTWIWQKCDGRYTPEQIAREFDQQYGVTNGPEIVLLGLKQLQESGLLEHENLPEESSSTGSMSRRAAAVAAGSALLPMLTSVLAPTSAAAKSKPDKPEKPKKPHKD